MKGSNMIRKIVDRLLTTGGVGLTLILLVVSGLTFWAYFYTNTTVHNQLASQAITLPSGQKVVDGAQAQAMANVIAKDLKVIGNGKTYAELATESLAHPNNAALAAQVQLVFRGTTLEGLLLNAYGWWRLGQIVLVGTIILWGMALVSAVLTIFGFRQLKREQP
jgi:hypothetical protein